MAKSTKKKRTTSNVNIIQTINKKRKEMKKSIQKKLLLSKKNTRRYSLTRKSRKNNLNYLSDTHEEETKKILLPQELLLNTKSLIKENSSIVYLRKAMKIYDIDENINYCFFEKCKKITSGNYKYLYTLNYEDRKRIMEKHKLKQNILSKSSKLIFFYLIQFLKNIFQPKDKESLATLNDYKLPYFGKFIIPISEGNEELKFYYFIDIVLKWLKDTALREKIEVHLSYFNDFFENIKNFDKVEEVFYIIFRINLLFFNQIDDYSILENVGLAIDEKIEEKIKKLNLIKDDIIENIDKIKINNKTVLTLKKENVKFKPTNYCFGKCYSAIHVIKNIVHKKYMSYDYFKMNKINYFDDDVKKKDVFIQLVNIMLSSRVIKEYYQKINVYHEYEFPFSQEDSKVSEYFWNKVI